MKNSERLERKGRHEGSPDRGRSSQTGQYPGVGANTNRCRRDVVTEQNFSSIGRRELQPTKNLARVQGSKGTLGTCHEGAHRLRIACATDLAIGTGLTETEAHRGPPGWVSPTVASPQLPPKERASGRSTPDVAEKERGKGQTRPGLQLRRPSALLSGRVSWHCIGRVFVTSRITTPGWGTGTLVGSRTVLTSSHILPWNAPWKTIVFYPAFWNWPFRGHLLRLSYLPLSIC